MIAHGIERFIPRKQHVSHEQNICGRDFVVGDIHGKVHLLYSQLHALGFNFDADRLFCTGDLIGKSSETIACFELLTKKWFFSVLGNHEQLFLLGFESSMYWESLRHQQGGWLDQNLEQYSLLWKWKTLVDIMMPLTRTVNLGHVKVGICHASSIQDWTAVQQRALSNEEIWTLLWSRPLIHPTENQRVLGVDYVFHGHSPVKSVTNVANRYWIDTLYRQQRLTIFELTRLCVNPSSDA